METIGVISRTKYFLKFLEVPSTDDEEIKKMAELQLVKDIPFPSDDLLYGFKKLGSCRKGHSYIMLAGSKNEDIDSSYYRNSPIHTELLYLYCAEKKLFSEDKVDFLVHIGEHESETIVADKGKIIFSRGFPNSSRFLEDLDKTMLAYKRDKKNPDPSRITVMYHSSVDMEGIKPHIKRHFGIAVRFYEYREDLLSMAGSSEIRLLPKHAREKRKNLDRKREFLFTALFSAVIFVLLAGLFGYKVIERKRLLSSLSEKYAGLNTGTRRLEEVSDMMDLMEKRIQGSRIVAGALNESRSLLPETLFISGVDYADAIITYRGHAPATEDIILFSDLIQKKEVFSSVRITRTEKKTLDSVEVTEFTLVCEISDR